MPSRRSAPSTSTTRKPYPQRCGLRSPNVFWCTPDPHFEVDESRFDLLTFAIREELEEFEADWAAWLLSPAGRFAQYYAARERLLTA
jgi:hypothetical protein